MCDRCNCIYGGIYIYELSCSRSGVPEGQGGEKTDIKYKNKIKKA